MKKFISVNSFIICILTMLMVFSFVGCKQSQTETKKYSASGPVNIVKETHSKEPDSDVEWKKNFNLTEINGKEYGTAGRLYIPSVGIDVKLEKGHLKEYGGSNNTQNICDKKDTAVYFRLDNQMVIADHDTQGFDKLYNVKKNDKAYIYKRSGIYRELQCTDAFMGINDKTDFGLKKGETPVIKLNDNGVTMYTCYHGDSYNVFMTFWKFI